MDSIIFDLDGTLWDTKFNVSTSFNYLLDKYDFKYFNKKMKSDMGHTIGETHKINMTDLKKSGGIIYKGVIDSLKSLSIDYKLFIVSNCGDGYIESFLEYYKLTDLFTDFIPASKYNISKTKAINNLISKYNLKKAIYVGDTLGDYNYAKEAGIPFIHARYGYYPLLEATYHIDNLSEVFNVIDIINNK